MKILVVDNGTKYRRQIQRLLNGNKIKVVRYNSINLGLVNQYDLMVLSGGRPFPVVGNEKLYQKEINLIKNFQKPIIGICLGFELIAYAFGAHLEFFHQKEKGIIELEIVAPDPIFKNIPNVKVFENHRWVIKRLPDCLLELAHSKDGIEVFKHKKRLIYGFQFHPEMFVEKTCGDEIFKNVFNIMLKTV